MSGPWLPYGRHLIDDDDVSAVINVLRSDWLTTGPAVSSFEAAFASAVGAPQAVAVQSGTAALHLAALTAGLGPGQRAIVPAITFAATANAVAMTGAMPWFADVDPDTGLMTPATLETAFDLARRDGVPVTAVLPVHLAGQVVDVAACAARAAASGAVLIEDACHALGSERSDGIVGACNASAAACFSLHPVKTIAGGEGGVVTTANPQWADQLRRLRNHGIVRSGFVDAGQAVDGGGCQNPWYYEMQSLGYNYRLSDIQAALAHSQLNKLHRFAERRRTLAARYDQLLLDGFGRHGPVRPAGRVAACRPLWHLYVVLVDFADLGISRAVVMDRLAVAGIGTQVHYLPVYRHPWYRDRIGVVRLPGAESWYARCLSLPLHVGMSDTDPDRVVAALMYAIDGPNAGPRGAIFRTA